MNKIDEFLKKGQIPKLSKEEMLDFQIEMANEQEGNMHLVDNIMCDKCKNRGYITFKKYVKLYNSFVEAIKDCECMRRRKIIRNAINSGLGDYIKKTFNDYVATEDWQKSYKELAVDFLKSEKEWFMMTGQSGSGKTLLCSIIANNLLRQNKVVQYITWTDFISRLKRDVMVDQQKVSDYLNELKTVEVLFIDELLKKYNETDLKYIIEIINFRYAKNLKTIITSERELKNLLGIDEATFSRVVERAGKYLINIPKDIKKNQRLKHIL